MQETDGLKNVFALCLRKLQALPKIPGIRSLVERAMAECWARPEEFRPLHRAGEAEQGDRGLPCKDVTTPGACHAIFVRAAGTRSDRDRSPAPFAPVENARLRRRARAVADPRAPRDARPSRGPSRRYRPRCWISAARCRNSASSTSTCSRAARRIGWRAGSREQVASAIAANGDSPPAERGDGGGLFSAAHRERAAG